MAEVTKFVKPRNALSCYLVSQMDSQYEQTADTPVPVSSSPGNEMGTIKVFEQTTDIWVFGFKQEDCRIQMGFLRCCQGSHLCIGASAEIHTTKLDLCLPMCFYPTEYGYMYWVGAEGKKRVLNYTYFIYTFNGASSWNLMRKWCVGFYEFKPHFVFYHLNTTFWRLGAGWVN